MIVKINKKVYYPGKQPIMIILDSRDKRFIKTMRKGNNKYCCFPRGMMKDAAEKFMKLD